MFILHRNETVRRFVLVLLLWQSLFIVVSQIVASNVPRCLPTPTTNQSFLENVTCFDVKCPFVFDMSQQLSFSPRCVHGTLGQARGSFVMSVKAGLVEDGHQLIS